MNSEDSIPLLLQRQIWQYEKWRGPRILGDQVGRPFYPKKNGLYENPTPGLYWLPTFEGANCEHWIQRLIDQRETLEILDICCGAGFAAKDIESHHPQASAYGVTAGLIYFHDTGDSAMALPETRLVYGNVGYLSDVMSNSLPGKQFDIIYSFAGLGDIPLPFLYLVTLIYPLLKQGGVAFLAHGTSDYSKTLGLDKLRTWLDGNGYLFEINTFPQTNNIDTCAFQKTHDSFNPPLVYTEHVQSIFIE